MVEELLVQRAIGGDRAAFAEIYGQYQESIHRYVFYRVGGDELLAEDITQEVFLRAWEGLQRCQYQPRPGAPFAAWLYKIVKNLITDHFRQWGVLGPLERLSLQGVEEEPLVAIEQEERRVRLYPRLYAAMSQLTEDQLQVVLLKFSGFSNAEVAAILGKTSGAVKALESRARTNLSALWENRAGEGVGSRTPLDVEKVLEELEEGVLKMEREFEAKIERAEIRERMRQVLAELDWPEILGDLFGTLDRAAQRTGVSKGTLRKRAEAGVFALPVGKRGTPTPLPLADYVRLLTGEQLIEEGYPLDLVVRVLKDQPAGLFAPPLATAAGTAVAVAPTEVGLTLDGLRPRLVRKLEDLKQRYVEIFDQRWDVDEILETATDLESLRQARDQLNQIVGELESLQVLPDGFSEEHLDFILNWIAEVPVEEQEK